MAISIAFILIIFKSESNSFPVQMVSYTNVFDLSNGINFYFKIMRLKWSFLMIPVQGIKSVYPVGSFRDFPPFSRSITENVTIYR